MRRLAEEPLLLASFTDHCFDHKRAGRRPVGMEVPGPDHKPQRIYGMFAALSFDEGKTWPVRRAVTLGGHARTLDGMTRTGSFLLDGSHAEPRGYLAATQTPDGVIHLISSGLALPVQPCLA